MFLDHSPFGTPVRAWPRRGNHPWVGAVIFAFAVPVVLLAIPPAGAVGSTVSPAWHRLYESVHPSNRSEFGLAYATPIGATP